MTSQEDNFKLRQLKRQTTEHDSSDKQQPAMLDLSLAQLAPACYIILRQCVFDNKVKENILTYSALELRNEEEKIL